MAGLTLTHLFSKALPGLDFDDAQDRRQSIKRSALTHGQLTAG